jgi:putative aldouronate transport system permease protein
MKTETKQIHKKYYERSTLWKTIKAYKYFYLLLLLPILYYVVFAYLPMYGMTLAFKQFRYDKGLFNSPWVGMKFFVQLFTDINFMSSFKNTLIISFSKILLCFPMPVILALVLNEVTNTKIKKTFQTIFTFPHFLSWVVVAGIIINIVSDKGAINQIITLFGGQNTNLLIDPKAFRPILYISQIWKEVGWDSIIYLAALAGINPEIYEASEIDGASRMQTMRYITWPSIKGTVTIMLILYIGSVMNSNFDQVFNLYSPSVYSVGDILDTYVYRQAFAMDPDFSYAAAIGLFKSVIGFALIYSANFVTTRLFKEEGLL